ncbi:hypothetical protein JTB14_012093 [Gonioctena quinquepunctata]|nr:hypothetical protein JTB14_012093 [Gonioctena quinquepunctata]
MKLNVMSLFEVNSDPARTLDPQNKITLVLCDLVEAVGNGMNSFPFKRPDILELWMKAVRRENWAPSKSSKLCGDHFLPIDHRVKPGCFTERLKPNAVPTVSSYPKHLLPKIAQLRRKIKKVELSVDVYIEDVISNTISPENIDLPVTSTSSQVQTLIDCETQTVSYQNILLQRKVKTLEQKQNPAEQSKKQECNTLHTVDCDGLRDYFVDFCSLMVLISVAYRC